MSASKTSMFGGIDLGGTKIQAVVTNDDSTVLGSSRRPTPTEGGPEAIIKALEDTLKDAALAAQIDPRNLQGVGIGSPGTIKDGTITGAHNLSEWEGSVDVATILGEKLGCEVAVDNDVNVATTAEFKLGAGQLYDSLLGVFWGTGVGAGIVLEGKIWSGLGAAGEIGHVVVDPNGPQCACGRSGCLEAYAGRASMEEYARKMVKKGHQTNLFEIMEQRERTRVTSGIWARALKSKDKLAIHTVDRAVQALGVAIASSLNILDVEGVIIGGGLGIRLGHPYAQRISNAMMPHLFVSETRAPHIHVAALGDLGGAIGASLLVNRD